MFRYIIVLYLVHYGKSFFNKFDCVKEQLLPSDEVLKNLGSCYLNMGYLILNNYKITKFSILKI